MRSVDEDLSIGEFAALSGLSPRALRLYGDAGVLEPIAIHPSTGYRTYQRGQLERAERVRLLRAGGVPVPDLLDFLDADPRAAGDLLSRHLVTIDAEHARARAAVLLVHDRITAPVRGDTVISTTIPRDALAAAFEAASRCCATEPEPVPALVGVRLTADADGLHLASSDRYCAAFVDIPCTWSGDVEAERLVPPGFVTSASAGWPASVDVQIVAHGVVINGQLIPTLDERFPQIDALQPLVDRLSEGLTVEVTQLEAALPMTDGPSDDEPNAVLAAAGASLIISRNDLAQPDREEVARIPATTAGSMPSACVSPWRLRSLLATMKDRVVLRLDAPEPIALGPAGDPSTRFLLMPVPPP